MSFFDIFRKKEVRALPLELNSSWTALQGGMNRTAEGLSVVFACVTAISSALSALPAYVYRNEGKKRVEATESHLTALIKIGPNKYQTWPDFIEFIVAQVLTRGNALVEIVADPWTGQLIGLNAYPWEWVNVIVLENGDLIYDLYIQKGTMGLRGARRRLTSSQVIHLRDRSDDGVIGLSRLQRCAAPIEQAQAIHDFTTATYQNGVFPSALVTSARNLDPEAQAGVRRGIEGLSAGPRNTGKVLVLPGEFGFHKLSITPEDQELLDSRKYSAEELCRVYQVPPPIIQDYSHNTFTNSEQAGRWFAQFCLLPWVRKIEAAFNRALFADSPFELSLDMSGFDRGTPETRWAAHAVAITNGVLTVDEIREIEGYSPLEG